mmetsp:Transcript_3425/g.11590  ORF Transcript_3425/g.11590 Transcript_3425/m.11590 type:complete len:255 (-) Transcript_3425:117-881(-)
MKFTTPLPLARCPPPSGPNDDPPYPSPMTTCSGAAADAPRGTLITPFRPSARLERSLRSVGSSDFVAAPIATASATASAACSAVSFSRFITVAAAIESCAGGGVFMSNRSRRSSFPRDVRYATTLPGPDACDRDSKRSTTSRYLSAETSSRRSASWRTKLSGSASAASRHAARCASCALDGTDANGSHPKRPPPLPFFSSSFFFSSASASAASASLDEDDEDVASSEATAAASFSFAVVFSSSFSPSPLSSASR